MVIAAKGNSGKHNCGSLDNGTLLHVAAERLTQLPGASMAYVRDIGAAPALYDLAGGQIEITAGQ